MADCTTVFDTLKDFLPVNILEKAIDETGADHGTKKFTVLRQLNTMMYAHLTQKTALRDITSNIASNKKLQEHTGTISASQLSRRNNQRDPEIFKTIFEATLKELSKHGGIRVIPGSWGTLKILDATIMRVCLSLFPWAYYRKTKAAVKMHTLFDLEKGLPENIIVTEGIYFVTRLKKNAVMETQSINAVSSESSVLSDREVILGTFYTKMQHPLRVIEVMDTSKGEPFCIATNRFDLTAEEIAQIYRLRWQIELFFKWIKQHLRIKKFFASSFNTVLNQLYRALILYMLLKLMHLLVGSRYDFLELVRHIANGLRNTVPELTKSLTRPNHRGISENGLTGKESMPHC